MRKLEPHFWMDVAAVQVGEDVLDVPVAVSIVMSSGLPAQFNRGGFSEAYFLQRPYMLWGVVFPEQWPRPAWRSTEVRPPRYIKLQNTVGHTIHLNGVEVPGLGTARRLLGDRVRLDPEAFPCEWCRARWGVSPYFGRYGCEGCAQAWPPVLLFHMATVDRDGRRDVMRLAEWWDAQGKPPRGYPIRDGILLEAG